MRVQWVVTVAAALLGTGVCFKTREEEDQFVRPRLELLTGSTPHDDMRNGSVYLYLDVYQLINVDEPHGLLTLKMWFYMYYYLPAIAWEPAEVGGFTALTLPMGSFWTPDLVPYDVVDVLYEGFQQQLLMYQGQAVAKSNSALVKLQCSFDVYHFPFDSQRCAFTVGQWASNNLSYNLDFEETMNPGMEMCLDFYTENDQWELVRPLSIHKGSREFKHFISFQTLEYEINLRRRPQFYLYVLMVPTITLVLLSSLTFLLPVESGEKVSLGVTILLSQIVSLLVLSDILPPSSKSFPLLGSYVLISIILISFSIVISVLVVNVHFCGKRELATIVKKMLSSKSVTLLGLEPLYETAAVSPLVTDSGEKTEEEDKNGPKEKADLSEEGIAERRAHEWAILARFVDRATLVVYFLASLVVTICLVGKIAVRD